MDRIGVSPFSGQAHSFTWHCALLVVTLNYSNSPWLLVGSDPTPTSLSLLTHCRCVGSLSVLAAPWSRYFRSSRRSVLSCSRLSRRVNLQHRGSFALFYPRRWLRRGIRRSARRRVKIMHVCLSRRHPAWSRSRLQLVNFLILLDNLACRDRSKTRSLWLKLGQPVAAGLGSQPSSCGRSSMLRSTRR